MTTLDRRAFVKMVLSSVAGWLLAWEGKTIAKKLSEEAEPEALCEADCPSWCSKVGEVGCRHDNSWEARTAIAEEPDDLLDDAYVVLLSDVPLDASPAEMDCVYGSQGFTMDYWPSRLTVGISSWAPGCPQMVVITSLDWRLQSEHDEQVQLIELADGHQHGFGNCVTTYIHRQTFIERWVGLDRRGIVELWDEDARALGAVSGSTFCAWDVSDLTDPGVASWGTGEAWSLDATVEGDQNDE